jgi:hypothetical protein
MLGVLLGLAMSEWPRPASMTNADQVRFLVMFAGIVAILGGLAGGLLSRDGWQMLAGAVAGAIAVGLLGVVVTLHLKGLIYSIVGGPLGAVAVYLHFLTRESPASMARAKALPRGEGVWDRELDR